MNINKIAKKIVADFESQPKVYVGTYAKYNNGDLTGQWVDLTDYSSYDDFLEYCAELHSDQDDPEFMFQDYEGFPKQYYGESGLKPELWDYIEAIQNYDQEMVDAILDEGYDLDQIDDFSFYADCSDVGDFAEVFIDETGGIENLGRQTLERYFDYQSYGRDLQMDVTMISYNNGYLVKWR